MKSAVALILAAVSLTTAFAAGEKIVIDTDNVTFAAVPRIESELKRGVSVKADVRKLLGEPQGDGECFLPGQTEPREVWFYEDFALTGYRQLAGVTILETRQQILLVFFKGETFDGYLWTSNALRGVAE